jgi:hypothetical protein
MVEDLAFSRGFSGGNIDMLVDIKTKGALLMHFSAYHQQVHRHELNPETQDRQRPDWFRQMPKLGIDNPCVTQ